MFAIEMTRAVLVQQKTLIGVDLSGPWLAMDVEMSQIHKLSKHESRRVYIEFQVQGYGNTFFASCGVIGSEGAWTEGAGSINDYGDESRILFFTAKLEEDKIVTDLT
jgi:hypothetical protein